VVESGEHTIPIVLELVQPVIAERRPGGGGGELGPNGSREGAEARAGHLDPRCGSVAAVAIGVPYAVPGRSDLLQGAAGRDAPRPALDDRLAGGRRRLLVSFLDEEPAALVRTSAKPPRSFSPSSVNFIEPAR
jgi:hypothetical protein